MRQRKTWHPPERTIALALTIAAHFVVAPAICDHPLRVEALGCTPTEGGNLPAIKVVSSKEDLQAIGRGPLLQYGCDDPQTRHYVLVSSGPGRLSVACPGGRFTVESPPGALAPERELALIMALAPGARGLGFVLRPAVSQETTLNEYDEYRVSVGVTGNRVCEFSVAPSTTDGFFGVFTDRTLHSVWITSVPPDEREASSFAIAEIVLVRDASTAETRHSAGLERTHL